MVVALTLGLRLPLAQAAALLATTSTCQPMKTKFSYREWYYAGANNLFDLTKDELMWYRLIVKGAL
jgi:hypothetical protein